MPSYAATRKGYLNLWKRAECRPAWQARIDPAVEKVQAGKAQYQAVEAATGVPWQLIGALHHMESGCRFDRHLHNGDPLTGRTTHVPAGRPHDGVPPFSWQESAIDALKLHELDTIKEWPIERMLYEAERFNGFGYYGRKVNSPYLWAGTNLYTAGKYVADGKYSASAISKQVGVAPILKVLLGGGSEMSFLTQFIGIAPSIVKAITDDKQDGTLATSALVEACGDIQSVTGDSVTPATLIGTIAALPFSQAVAVVTAAEAAFSALSPADGAPVAAKPSMSAFDALFGEKLTGWKTYIAIGAAVLVNGAAALGVAPGVLTPEVVTAIDTLLAGLGGASLISKIERMFS